MELCQPGRRSCNGGRRQRGRGPARNAGRIRRGQRERLDGLHRTQISADTSSVGKRALSECQGKKGIGSLLRDRFRLLELQQPCHREGIRGRPVGDVGGREAGRDLRVLLGHQRRRLPEDGEIRVDAAHERVDFRLGIDIERGGEFGLDPLSVSRREQGEELLVLVEERVTDQFRSAAFRGAAEEIQLE